jgi:hypothetical protein
VGQGMRETRGMTRMLMHCIFSFNNYAPPLLFNICMKIAALSYTDEDGFPISIFTFDLGYLLLYGGEKGIVPFNSKTTGIKQYRT